MSAGGQTCARLWSLVLSVNCPIRSHKGLETNGSKARKWNVCGGNTIVPSLQFGVLQYLSCHSRMSGTQKSTVSSEQMHYTSQQRAWKLTPFAWNCREVLLWHAHRGAPEPGLASPSRL